MFNYFNVLASSFEKDNLGWRIKLIQQQWQEWQELQLAKLGDRVPDFPLFNWLKSPLLWDIIKIISWIIISLFIVWLVWQIWLLLRPFIYSFRNPLRQSFRDRASSSSIKQLSTSDWLIRSQKFQQQGDYHQACICLYQATLQRLNDSKVILHQSSRTDGEYLQLVRELSKQNAYEKLLMTHQKLCFSSSQASRSLFEECQQAYREIEMI
jgi:hypothetical protein